MITVVIPFTDGGAFQTLRLLNSLKKQTAPCKILCVGASKDGTGEFLRTQCDVIKNMSVDTSYGTNANLGLFASSTKYTIIINNDTVVETDFIERMGAYADALAPFGMIGPMSNCVMADQLIQPTRPLDVEAVNKDIASKDLMFAPTISGFCFITHTETFKKVGGFDPVFVNGNEDVDLSIRFLNEGFANYVARSCYVYHEGGASLPQECVGGIYNRHILAKKWFEKPKDWTIGCYLRVKASREEVFKWLDWHHKIFDKIIIIDDGSSIKWGDVKERFKNVIIEVDRIGQSEGAQRAAGVDLARLSGVNALCNLDHDEFFEPKVSRATLQRLLNLPLPDKWGFLGRFMHLWDSAKTYNVKYPPQYHMFMVKLAPGVPYIYHDTNDRFHGQRLPFMPPSAVAPTNIRIIHEGYMRAELREEKRTWYEREDKIKAKEDIGYDGYEHMTQKHNILMNHWSWDSDDYTISLNMMAEHEEEFRVQIALEEISPLVDEIIFRTAPDQPSLKAIAKMFDAHILEAPWTDDFGRARNQLLERSRSSYVLSLDPDEALGAPLEISELVNAQPGGVVFSIITDNKLYTEGIRLFKRAQAIWNGPIHEMVSIPKGEIIRAKGIIHHEGQAKPKMWHRLNEKMIALSPDDPRPYFSEGMIAREEGNLVKAEALFRKALSLDKGYIIAEVELGKLFFLMGLILFTDLVNKVNDDHPLRASMKKLAQTASGLVGEDDFERFIKR